MYSLKQNGLFAVRYDAAHTQEKPGGCNDISHFHIMHETCSDPVTGHRFSVWLLGQAKKIKKLQSDTADLSFYAVDT